MMKPLLSWFSARSPREQVLVFLLAGLAALLLSMLAVFRPLLDWRAEAATRAAARAEEFRLVSAAARATSQSSMVDQKTPVRNALAEAAAASGVELSFVNARDDGSVEAQISASAPDAVFSMLTALERRYGVRPTAFDAARVSDGAADIRVQMTLGR